jgi:hypothetical protein
MNNLNNILIALFTILFCYILFYWIYKSCFGYKIIEGVDGDNSASATSATSTDTKTGPKVVTKESVKKEDENKSKPPSSKDAEEQANSANQQMLVNNQKRQEANQESPTSGTTPSSDKLLQAKFS